MERIEAEKLQQQELDRLSKDAEEFTRFKAKEAKDAESRMEQDYQQSDFQEEAKDEIPSSPARVRIIETTSQLRQSTQGNRVSTDGSDFNKPLQNMLGTNEFKSKQYSKPSFASKPIVVKFDK